MGGILGTTGSDARLASDLALLAYILLIVPGMLVGLVFARRKMFKPYHKITMTAVLITNWLIILFLMMVSYSKWVLPFLDLGLGSPVRLLPIIHGITGGIAQLLGTWMVVLMWTEKTRYAWVLPKPLKIRNIKPVMRTTLALWLVTAALGVTIFLTWYPPSKGSAESAQPVATPEVTPAVTTEAQSETTSQAPAETPEMIEPIDKPAATDQAPVATEDAPATTLEVKPETTHTVRPTDQPKPTAKPTEAEPVITPEATP